MTYKANRREQEAAAREKTDERLHGLGAGGEEEAGRAATAAAQRRAFQDAGKAVEVSSDDVQTII